MADSTRKPKAATLDELFGIPANPAENLPDGLSASEVIVEMPLEWMDNFNNHPYGVRKDRITMGIYNDIKKTGKPEQPGIVRPKPNGRYELIAGHRRRLACTLAEISTMPVIVREMTDDEAVISMVRSNTQREDVLPSEKAHAYKMRMEAEARQGQRTDLTSTTMARKLKGEETADIIGKEFGISGDTVRHYIRLNELIPHILEMVDRNYMKSRDMEAESAEGEFNKGIAFRPAVEISYLSKEEQQVLLDTMQAEDCTPSVAQAKRMKKLHEDGHLTADVIFSILTEEKPNQKETYKIKRERISKYIPKNYTPEQTEEYIVKAVEHYSRFRERQKQQTR